MFERYLTALHLEDAGDEEPAATRERLREHFPRGATRRMTQLGLLVSRTLLGLDPRETDTVLYASEYAETRALEAYLESFPTASPTLFQTSIHPSAVQQGLIGRQQPIGTLLPMTGREHLVAQALVTALLAPAERVLFCGGEERGSWLLEQKAASDCTYAFAVALATAPAGALAHLRLDLPASPLPADPLPPARWFEALVHRQPLTLGSPAGGRLTLHWL